MKAQAEARKNKIRLYFITILLMVYGFYIGRGGNGLSSIQPCPVCRGCVLGIAPPYRELILCAVLTQPLSAPEVRTPPNLDVHLFPVSCRALTFL